MTNYKILKNIAIVLGLLSFIWFVYELINNYKTINSDYFKANNFFMDKDYQKALDMYKKVSDLDSTNLYALEGQARSLTRMNQLAEAEELFLKIIHEDKNFLPALTNIGILYDLKGEYYKAIYYYEKALEKDKSINKGMGWFKRFLKNIQFKPSNIQDRYLYLKKQLKLNVSEQKFKNLEMDTKQPDFQK